MNLRELMGYIPKRRVMTTYEKEARRLIRQLTFTGLGAYECWEIAEKMAELSLYEQENPDLFPPNQRILRKQSNSI